MRYLIPCFFICMFSYAPVGDDSKNRVSAAVFDAADPELEKAKQAGKAFSLVVPGMKRADVEALIGLPRNGKYEYYDLGEDFYHPNRYQEIYWLYLEFDERAKFDTGKHLVALLFEQRPGGDVLIKDMGPLGRCE